MKKYHVLFFVMIVSIPLFLLFNVWQSNKCGEIRKEIQNIEFQQEYYVEKNKSAATEIADLLAIDKLELDAQRKLGLKKMRPENVKLIIMGGEKGREL